VAHLIQLRQKIKSIQTTKKITHAVRLVSMSLYARMEKQDVPLKRYVTTMQQLFIRLSQCVSDWKSPFLLSEEATNTNPLVIIIGTSKGLCGSLNSNLFRYFESTFEFGDAKNLNIITIGQKATKFMKEQTRGTLICSYAELNSNNFITIADDLVVKLKVSQFSSVVMYSTELKSFFVQKPFHTQIIPINSMQADRQAKIQDQTYDQINDFDGLEEDSLIWEQDRYELLDYLAPQYLQSMIMHILFQALRAEHAARFLAMENSTANAEKYLEKLTLQYNKLRQSLITREVAELCASFPTR